MFVEKNRSLQSFRRRAASSMAVGRKELFTLSVNPKRKHSETVFSNSDLFHVQLG